MLYNKLYIFKYTDRNVYDESDFFVYLHNHRMLTKPIFQIGAKFSKFKTVPKVAAVIFLKMLWFVTNLAPGSGLGHFATSKPLDANFSSIPGQF